MNLTDNYQTAIDIEADFELSAEFKTIVTPGQPRLFFEHGQWWVRIEDNHYDVEDPESVRTFSVVECQDEDGFDYCGFEEV